MAERLEHLLRVKEVQQPAPAASRRSSAGRCSRRIRRRCRTCRRPMPSTTCAPWPSPSVLDNVPNMQSSWVTMGMKIGQVALRFGCNDFGSLMIEENVVSAANTTHRTSDRGDGAAHHGCGLHAAPAPAGLLDDRRAGSCRVRRGAPTPEPPLSTRSTAAVRPYRHRLRLASLRAGTSDHTRRRHHPFDRDAGGAFRRGCDRARPH
jgi:hypothetical protein